MIFVHPKFTNKESGSLSIEKGRPLLPFARTDFGNLSALCCLHGDWLCHFINTRQSGLRTDDFSQETTMELAVNKLKESLLVHQDRGQSIILHWSTHKLVKRVGQR